MTENPDQETIIKIFDSIVYDVGVILDEDYDGCPGSQPNLTPEMDKELKVIEHALNRLFSLARSSVP